MSPPKLRLSNAGVFTLVVLIALGHCLAALFAMREKSTTADEMAHIVGGYTFNHWNDYRMHPENGLLPQRWQALPVTLAGAHYPALNSHSWQESDVWMTGHAFFYDLGNDHEWFLFAARAMNTIWAAGLIVLVAIWARYFCGDVAALIAALFGACCPTMLAHSALATSDMAMAFFLLASVSAFWWHLQDGRKRLMLLSCVTFGLACVAKYTAVLLPPLFLAMGLIRLTNPQPLVFGRKIFANRAGRLTAMIPSLLAHGVVALATIWAFCGFRYSAFNPNLPPGEFNASWEYVLSFGGLKAAIINFCRAWHLLPEAYLYGFSFVLKFAEARGAFLDGDYSIRGWVSFFPKTFLYKTPLSLLLALTLASGITALAAARQGLGRLRGTLYRAAPLIFLFGLYWLISLTSHLNIGHRHILPTYPVLYIFCGVTLAGAAIKAWDDSKIKGVILTACIAGLLTWHAATAASMYPHYLAYFNPIAGGPAQGYRHLADSSLDWGQDLPGLKRWLQANQKPGEKVYLSYFGTGEPDFYGIDAIRMPMIHAFRRDRPMYWFEPGVYVLSATMLQHVYMSIRGPWTLKNEREYQELKRNDQNFRALQQNPHEHPELLSDITSEQWNKAWYLYEQLRFARLCHYLRARHPDAMIGYSILIFRLSQEELNAALFGSATQWQQAIERASNDSR